MGLMEADDDGALWFFASKDSQKIDEINADQEVSVTFANEAQHTYISMCGTVSVVRDLRKQKEL
jgi:general stress protein 26